MNSTIYIHISGGCYRHLDNLPEGITVEVVDWDNLLPDDGSSGDWNLLEPAAQQLIRENYAHEYRLIQARLGEGIR